MHEAESSFFQVLTPTPRKVSHGILHKLLLIDVTGNPTPSYHTVSHVMEHMLLFSSMRQKDVASVGSLRLILMTSENMMYGLRDDEDRRFDQPLLVNSLVTVTDFRYVGHRLFTSPWYCQESTTGAKSLQVVRICECRELAAFFPWSESLMADISRSGTEQDPESCHK